MESILKGKKILIVDDEPDLRDILCDEFDIVGATVMSAPNGNDAFKMILSNLYDAVVSDVRMPGGDGIELLDRVKERDTKSPIVFLVTGYSDLSEAHALAKGAESVFSKPFDGNKLTQSVAASLMSPKLRWSSSNPVKEGAVLDAEIKPITVSLKTPLHLTSGKPADEPRVVSLGRGGVFIALSGGVPHQGNIIPFEINFAEGALKQISGVGRVRWARAKESNGLAAGIGLEFLELAPPCLEAVLELIEQEKSKAFIPLQ